VAIRQSSFYELGLASFKGSSLVLREPSVKLRVGHKLACCCYRDISASRVPFDHKALDARIFGLSLARPGFPGKFTAASVFADGIRAGNKGHEGLHLLPLVWEKKSPLARRRGDS
jgi:hypothetical protein